MTTLFAMLLGLSIMGTNALITDELPLAPPTAQIAPEKDRAWVPEPLPASTFIHVRPTVPMHSGGYR